MKSYTIEITEEDLEAAKAFPWDTTTCIVAQAFKRATGITPSGGGSSGFYVKREDRGLYSEDTYHFDKNLIDIISAFDNAHQQGGNKDYSKVLRLLPITVQATLE